LRSVCENETVPVGDEPVTVAVHVAQAVNPSESGVHFTVVVVGAGLASATGTMLAVTEKTRIPIRKSGGSLLQ
jgi:hypothetical protein